MNMLTRLLICLLVSRPVCLQLHRESGCSYLNNAFQTFCTRESDRIIHGSAQGLPGKRGANGEKGEKGETGGLGPIGVVNYTSIENSIQEKIRQEMRSHVEALASANERIKELEDSQERRSRDAALARANERIKQLEDRQGLCPVKYNGKCFWMEVRYETITYAAAQRLCETLNAIPANIYSEILYGRISRYVRSLIYPGQSILLAWIGLRYNTNDKRLLLYNGSVATFEKWHEGFPRSSGHRMGINIRVPWNARAQHMWNIDSYPATGVICEK